MATKIEVGLLALSMATRDESNLAQRISALHQNDAQFRDAAPLESVTAALQQPGLSLPQIVRIVTESYADRPALGQRARKLISDPVGRSVTQLLPHFDMVSYGELGRQIEALAADWHHDANNPLLPGDVVGILGFPSANYATVDLACVRLGAVAVSLQTTAPLAQLISILTETEPRLLAVGMGSLELAVDAILNGIAPQRLLVFDYHPQDDAEREIFERAISRLAGRAVVVDTLGAALARGRDLPEAPMITDADDERLAALLYTSGSTGLPKGAMYTERMVAGYWVRGSTVPLITLAYLPMSHYGGRASLAGTLASGGTAYFPANADMSTLFDDLALVRPTVLTAVPRVCEMIVHRFHQEVGRRISDEADRARIEAEVKAFMQRTIIGGRVLAAVGGSAPQSDEMTALVESVLDAHLMIGYGCTEVGGVAVDGRVQRPPVIDYKLVDVPELGYYSTDKPHPRGELVINSKVVTPGYFKRADVTAKTFDENGYYKTGDIMAEIEPDHLVFVERRNNVLKLSQGEFVAISRLEALFSRSPLVHQIYIYGSSERAYLLAVVVPDGNAIAQLGRAGHTEEIRQQLSESLLRIAADEQLNSYEIPREFIIETEPWTIESGLLTGIAKLARPALKSRYGDRLEQLYVEIAENRAADLRTLQADAAKLSAVAIVVRAVAVTLGLSSAGLSANVRYLDLGGDSLTALSLSNLLQELFGVDVPVSVVMDPSNDLSDIARFVEAQRDSSGARITIRSVHQRDGATVYASDLKLEKFIDAATLSTAATLPAPSGSVSTVLLTGANGYLGRFLCLEWLENLAATGGKLICIVRSNDAVTARQRIEASMDTGDTELLERFRALADQRLEVLAGDIGESNLGLDQVTWDRLAHTVDLIVHSAALVNHVLPYSQLFGPNVVGTAELLRLALTSRLKPLSYVSTIGAAIFGQHHVIGEDDDIRQACPVHTLDDSYGGGYAISKWAGEVLAREAHELCGLPVAVFRSNMILAHSRYVGQLNMSDVFTRLILSLMATGIAPRSFYRLDTGGARPHYDGLAVDFIAEAIVALGARAARGGYHTYSVVNPHDDGISLDQFVGWLIDAGCQIQRIQDYDEWLARFQTALRSLPDDQRRQSVLPVLGAYAAPQAVIAGSPAPAHRFSDEVRAAGISADGAIPHLSADLMHKYIGDLEHASIEGSLVVTTTGRLPRMRQAVLGNLGCLGGNRKVDTGSP